MNVDRIAEIEADLGWVSAADVANLYASNRIALGFPIANIPVIPWRTYRGYDTPEDRDMNESAVDVGDDPDDWYVSEQNIDVTQIGEFWNAESVLKRRLERARYVDDIRRMVAMCRNGRATGTSVFVPRRGCQRARSLSRPGDGPIRHRRES